MPSCDNLCESPCVSGAVSGQLHLNSVKIQAETLCSNAVCCTEKQTRCLTWVKQPCSLVDSREMTLLHRSLLQPALPDARQLNKLDICRTQGEAANNIISRDTANTYRKHTSRLCSQTGMQRNPQVRPQIAASRHRRFSAQCCVALISQVPPASQH